MMIMKGCAGDSGWAGRDLAPDPWGAADSSASHSLFLLLGSEDVEIAVAIRHHACRQTPFGPS